MPCSDTAQHGGVKGMREDQGQGWEQQIPLSLAHRQGISPGFGVPVLL